MTATIKKAIETYFLSNWSTTSIQWEGTSLNYDSKTSYIGLIYNPIENDRYGFDGTTTGRIRCAGIQQVRCYAKNRTKAYELADSIKTFLNGKQISNIVFDIGQDETAIELDNNWQQVNVNFDTIKYN